MSERVTIRTTSNSSGTWWEFKFPTFVPITVQFTIIAMYENLCSKLCYSFRCGFANSLELLVLDNTLSELLNCVPCHCQKIIECNLLALILTLPSWMRWVPEVFTRSSTCIANSFCFPVKSAWWILFYSFCWFNMQARELFCLSVWSDRAWILWRDCKPITP